ncbi:hypothetical protein DNTS_035134 [Danionella cerebrum]|uniref:Bromodomain adjacent to zinc finger domain protein 2A n=1 Tax=Danionella cerebrum TaxID=2873325 RepID=A0A553N605_9TELE|nr:hypothetical protein DNTS_035134 [Danionella translucida]
MEANNHFNYGPPSSVSANSGLKHSSGDSLYTNGSSTSFPQQGKNLNGEMNVNGITTAGGSSQGAAHPPSSSYPHMSNHHLPGNIGYDFLWNQSQFSPAMGPVPPHGLHQKPGSQHHFQGHGAYQINGIGPPRQPPASGVQFWGRSNPPPQQTGSVGLGFNPPSIYGSFTSQDHQSVQPPQHHQHQPGPTRHLQHSSHQHQQPQQQNYGLLPNGLPFFQRPPSQSQMGHSASQSFTPPPGSPEQLLMTGGNNSSPQSTQVRPPSPKNREIQVHANESLKETDNGYNGVEGCPVPQQFPNSEGSSTSSIHSVKQLSAGLDTPPKPPEAKDVMRKEARSSPISGPPPPPPLASLLWKTTNLPQKGTVLESHTTLSTASGLSANSSVTQPTHTPTQVVQGQTFGLPTLSTADATSSMSSSKTSHAPPALSQSQSVVYASKKFIQPPLADARELKTPKASPTPLSSAVSPSLVYATPPLALLKGPQEGSPLTGQSPKHPAASSTPTSASSKVSPLAVSALPLDVSASQVAIQASPAPPQTLSYTQSSSGVSAATNTSDSLIGFANKHSAMRPSVSSLGVVDKVGGSYSEACSSQSNIAFISSSKEFNTDARPEKLVTKSHGGTPEPTFLVPKQPGRESMVFIRKDSSCIKDLVDQRKEECDSLNDTLGTDQSLIGSSLAQSTYLDSSRAEDGSLTMEMFDSTYSLSQSIDQSRHAEDSVVDSSRDLEDHSYGENFNRSITSSSSAEERSLEDNSSLLEDSFTNISQTSSSTLSTSMIASTQSIKVDHNLDHNNGPDLSVMTTKAQQGTAWGSGMAGNFPGNLITIPTKKPRKPRTPKIKDASTENSKINKRKLPDGQKAEKVWRRKNKEENLPMIIKKRKLSKSAKEPEGFTADSSTPSHFPLPPVPKIFIQAMNLTINEGLTSQPKKIWKHKMKEDVSEEMSSKLGHAEFAEEKTEDDEDEDDEKGDTRRRRVASEEQVQFPLQHGWKREIRVRRHEDRLKGETWYYSPCGRRMKQFPEVIKFLKKHHERLNGVSREHFSFSPRMPVGDFYEERETPEGKMWVLLANEEVPSMIMAITGRRGRPPNPDKEPRPSGRRARGQGRRPGRPPKFKMEELLSKVDVRLMKKLEAKEELAEEEKEKLAKLKKKMKRKARLKRKEDSKNKKVRQEKQKGRQWEKVKDLEQNGDLSLSHSSESTLSASEGPKKPGRRRKVAVPVMEPLDPEPASPIKTVARERCKAKALAKAQAQAEAEAKAVLAAKKQAERRALAQRRMEERKRQQMLLEEMKKPAEDMCLPDHMPLPSLSRIPGLVLSGLAFSNCLNVVEFLHGYGKILGLQVPKDIPSLSTLQEGLLGMEKSQAELLDLLIKLVEAALHDPGLPSYYQSVKILGEKLVDLELNHTTVSEVLRIFLEAHGFEPEVCNSLRTKSFQTLKPDVKASILGFLVEELNAKIDNTLENMATYRKNKWIIEGKLRKLKAVLMRKTGRPEEEICFEERRRSARVGQAEEEGIEECCIESPNTCSVVELERQIDKLTKRQVFFRKKLQQSSHTMRAVSLGQDRYRRRYLLLPYMGCILVEGAEDVLASGEVTVSDEPVTYVKVITPIKTEVKSEPALSPRPSSPRRSHLSPSEVDPLPGEASLMSTPRGRGRPRKIKPEVELHLRTAKSRRRRRSSRSAAEDSGMSSPMQDQHSLAPPQGNDEDINAPSSGAGCGPENGQPDCVHEEAEKQGQWFNVLPKEPCDENSVSQPCEGTPASAEDAPTPREGDPLNICPVQSLKEEVQAEALPLSISIPLPIPGPQVSSTPSPRAGRRRRRGSGPSRIHSRTSPAKRRGRPPSKLFQEVQLKYFTQLQVKPIPLEMVKGWWWIREPVELTAILSTLHPRGIREKILHKHLSKHMEHLAEVCTRPINDPIFQVKAEEQDALLEASKQQWQEQERTMQIDISLLQWVEELEQKVVGADLQLKVAIPGSENETEDSQESSKPQFQIFTPPEADSSRDDLEYYDHEVDPRDDWIVRTKKEWSDLLRVPNNPLDLAVLRLCNLERNIERRFLKEPLWNSADVIRLAPLTPPHGDKDVPLDAVSLESEITPRLRTWRQALDRCRSAPQLALCLLQLEKAIAWERSIIKVTCQICRKGDDDEFLLLCDGCDRGCHMFCLKPKVMQVPEGDWFCPTCTGKKTGESPRSARQRSKVAKRRLAEDSSDEDEVIRRGMSTRKKDSAASSSGTNISPSKRRRMTTRNQPDLTYCEIILMEMEAHTDAWPFLEPVNPRMVPGYRRIIKNPMDFLTMRERLLQGGYCSCEEFAADAQLVFNNCELFNEDTSEVGLAGHSMRRFFESRWAEFYENKDK